jgi:dihydrofolate reductase
MAMRKLVAGFAASLDGYIEGPQGEYDWILIDKEVNFTEQMKRFDAFFLGRRTYEKVRSMGGPPTPGIRQYVFSTTLTTVAPGFELIREHIRSTVEALKNSEGRDIALFGGASLLASLLDLHLVDEVSVSLIPVLLGRGRPMVEQLKVKAWLTLLDTKTYGNGTVMLRYAVTY